ncbi:hypothetical protein U879_11780 [Defluviimonas sp. 20V17]|uniref:Mannosyl-glycoprotein endo-beta-N-acetylglucosaminidase n=1 Tax=Allgaiera indica TaxID=765699 RepID=A0AAN4UMB7_9RHOB|nr:glucosaminidase domain-containing protein [Allgaiera indica]KDB03491.1 hypothetical protein U879_11780 [Defluviimonas sp. 20V17]GHD98112.1 hypothetical protein GCM10008024_00320 [Allgaiera indica]SDW53649.1 Mannosyl-glycoprotein endo-beta-N-acetylglucosaminidase [Allgaiera indica]
MLVTSPRNPAETGPQGLKLVAEAEKLEALLWEQVLTSMTRSALPAGSLGTGSQLYNGLATRALASKMFGSTDSGLTRQIVAQLKTEIGGSGTSSGLQAPSTLQALSAHAGVQGAAALAPEARAVSYARAVWPAIKATAASLQVPPVAILAQSALETGWGASTPGNNLFGIKAVGAQAATRAATHEEVGGALTPTEARFAAFGSGADCLTHYAGLIRRVYPQAMGAGSVAQYADALARGGYATDSNYARKIVATAQSPLMQSVLHAVEGATL